MVRFWREMPSRYNLIGSKCGNCGNITFPTRDLCPSCHRKSIGKMVHHKLDPQGEVVSYTIIHEAQRGFEMQVPYIMAIVQMKDGVRVTSQVVDCNPDEVSIGTPVKAVFRKISEDGLEGTIQYGFKFVLKDQVY